jgi:putative ubiquitin-RnfH superfamily antitoxin RatB of RatAB toxin-antitoxin module
MTVASDSSGLPVEVVYALADAPFRISLRIAPGTSVRRVLECAGVFERFPQLDSPALRVGIDGVPCDTVTPVEEANVRIEIYRPLADDVKQRRRARAARERQRQGIG